MSQDFKNCKEISQYIKQNYGLDVYVHKEQGGYGTKYLKFIFITSQNKLDVYSTKNIGAIYCVEKEFIDQAAREITYYTNPHMCDICDAKISYEQCFQKHMKICEKCQHTIR